MIQSFASQIAHKACWRWLGNTLYQLPENPSYLQMDNWNGPCTPVRNLSRHHLSPLLGMLAKPLQLYTSKLCSPAASLAASSLYLYLPLPLDSSVHYNIVWYLPSWFLSRDKTRLKIAGRQWLKQSKFDKELSEQDSRCKRLDPYYPQ
jgi:hypothetical protein